MHSRIFQLSEEPINPDDYIQEEDFFDDFVGYVADYVDGNTNRKEDIEWFVRSLKPFGLIYDEKEESIIFPEDFKTRYFKNNYEKFMESVHSLDLNKFSNDWFSMYLLQSLIEDKHSFYVYINCCYETLDRFVRSLRGEEKYYIGGTMDYHF